MQLAVALADRASFINPGDEIVPGIQAVDAAGHSPGMLAFLIASGGKRLLNLGPIPAAIMWWSVQRPDIHFDVDDDKEMAVPRHASASSIWPQPTSSSSSAITCRSPAIGFVERGARKLSLGAA